MPTEIDSAPDPLPIATRGPVDIVVRPPGSKSQTNRALVCAAMADGFSTLRQPLSSDDSWAMRRCLTLLGVSVTDSGPAWLVTGTGGRFDAGPPLVLDAGASGTTARFVTAVAALVPRSVTIDGTQRMRARPIGPLVQALSQVGADIDDQGGFPPVTVHGGHLTGGPVSMDASVSSQFASALLMVAPMADEPTTLTVTGLASAGYVTTTIEVMRSFGVDVKHDHSRFDIPVGSYQAAEVTIEADASAAVYPWAAAAVTGGVAQIQGIPPHSSQPDLAILEVLRTMGCDIDGHRVQGTSELQAVDMDLSHMPDGAMTVAVLCAMAKGTSRLRGLATLRVKETDRLVALATELSRVGATVSIDGDALVVEGGHRLSGATIETYDDHRMAMAFSILGLVVSGVAIADPHCVTKTWPGYFEELDQW